jgi:hypothetical protein
MKIASSVLVYLLFAGLIISSLGCGNQSENSGVENDSLLTEAHNEATNEENKNGEAKSKLLVLIPGALEIGIPQGVNEIERKKSKLEDSLFFEVEMGINPMDLRFNVFKCTDDSMSLDQMERQALYISDDGKTFEVDSAKKYYSQWYGLPFFTDNNFRLTTYKREDDYPTIEDDATANGSIKLKEGQTLSQIDTTSGLPQEKRASLVFLFWC